MQQPETRDVSEVVAALEDVEWRLQQILEDAELPSGEPARIAEAELRFQSARIAATVKPETEDEGGHLSDLMHGYEQAADLLAALGRFKQGLRYVSILRKYQQGRLERQRDAPAPAGVDERGRAIAFNEE